MKNYEKINSKSLEIVSVLSLWLEVWIPSGLLTLWAGPSERGPPDIRIFMKPHVRIRLNSSESIYMKRIEKATTWFSCLLQSGTCLQSLAVA